MADHPTGRRELIALAAGAAFAAAAAPLAYDQRSPPERARTFMLLRGALDGQLVIGGSSGCYYGVVDGQTTPLFGFVSASFARYRKAPGGGFEGASYEVPFFTDLSTGMLLEHWKNPYTGEIVPAPQPTMPPAKIVFTADLELRLLHASPGMQLNHTVLPAVVSGDDVWMVEQSFATFQMTGAAKPAHFAEIVTLHGSLKALQAPHATRVPCLTYYQGIGGWRPWQKMGDRPGTLTGNGAGRYGLTMQELPAAWHEMTRALRPDVLNNPDAALAKLLDS